MRGFMFSGLIALGLGAMPMAAFAQVSNQGLQEQEDTPKAELMALGGELFLEIIPEKFITVQEETPAEYLDQWDWVTIPATFETVTKTVVVQEAYSIIKFKPAEIATDGTILDKAAATVETVPAVTKTVSRRVVKTPARRVWRKIPNTFHPGTLRKRVNGEIYIIRDETGAEVKRYDDPAAFAEFVNGL